jgi:hypothetical protein
VVDGADELAKVGVWLDAKARFFFPVVAYVKSGIEPAHEERWWDGDEIVVCDYGLG